MGQRGPRKGTGGRPKKAISEKIADGNPGKRELEIIDFPATEDIDGADMPKPSEYMSAEQANGAKLHAVEIFEETWKWLNERGCAKLIAPQMLERYAMAQARYIQVEEAMSKYGFVAKHPTTKLPCTSPFVVMEQNYMALANKAWLDIFQIVKENSMTGIGDSNPRDDMMERLLSSG